MRLEGTQKLKRQLRHLQASERKHVTDAVAKSVHEGVRVAKVLAPDVTGQTKSEIFARFKEGGLVGTVEVIDPAASRSEKDRTYSIEHGRKKGIRGKTVGSHYVWRTRQYLEKRWKGRIRRALNKAAKEAASRG